MGTCANVFQGRSAPVNDRRRLRALSARAVKPREGVMTSFLIIDDHPLFREALGNAVRLALPEAQIFEAMSINDALHILASEQGIDLALLDLSLPDATGFSGFLRLRETHPRLPVAIVSSEEDQHVVREALCLVPPVICRNRHRSGAGVVDRGRPQRFGSRF